MVKRKKLSAAEADLLAMKLRRENMVASHKAMEEEWRVRQRIQTAEGIKNMQNQYGALVEAHSRLPLGLQGPALRKMLEIGLALKRARTLYPANFPQGPDPTTLNIEEIRRNRQ